MTDSTGSTGSPDSSDRPSATHNSPDNSPSESTPPDLDRLLQQIAKTGQAGQLVEAETQCQQLLQEHPDIARAWDILGLVKLQQGQPQTALQYVEQAIALDATQAEFHDHAGVIQCSLENFAAGVHCYQQALALNPRLAHVHYNLGLAQSKLGHIHEAMRTFLTLIAQHPRHAPAHYQVGNLCHHQHQFTAAIAHYQQALHYQPQYTEAWHNLGVALQTIGEIDQARDAYQHALSLNPQYVEALNALGSIFEKQNHVTAAIEHYQRTLALQPNYIPALMNLGNIQMRLGELAEATRLYCHVLRLDAHHIQALDRLIKIQLRLCQWTDLDDHITQLKTIAQCRTHQALPRDILPFNSLFLPFTAADQHAIAQDHALAISQRMKDQRVTIGKSLSESLSRSHAKIRLGYVSGDFRCHAVGQLILRLFELHDRRQFDVFAYSLGPDDGSEERQKLMNDCDYFRDISDVSPKQCAQIIIQDEIDILIDLSGYTDYSSPELFALRSAPLQVNYLGYPGTLGSDCMDYIIADSIVIPEKLATHFTEACLYLPDSYQINNDRQFYPNLSFRQLITDSPTNSPFVFCCFNKSEKITPHLFTVWMRILTRVPDSVLWLLRDRSEMEANLRTEAYNHGVDPDRLVFVDRVSKQDHLTRHTQTDLFLDTVYYNAHVTASDALWVGVPLITIQGETFASRVAASLLTAIGLPELITSTLQDYEDLAVHLATHPTELQHLKEKLATQRHQTPLFNTALTVRHLEAGYRQIWERYRSGYTPAPIWVERIDAEDLNFEYKQNDEQRNKHKNELNQEQNQELPSPLQTDVINYTSVASLPTSPDKRDEPHPYPIVCTVDEGFYNWIRHANGSLIITTYQAGKVIVVGWDGQQVTVLPRQFAKPMGIAIANQSIALATHHEVILFANADALAHDYLANQPGRYDALFLPRVAYFTGDLQLHDLAYGDEGLWMVNTRFSCLAHLSSEFSFVPRWQPSFVTALTPDDRCHLNGVAMVAGKPQYVTALGQSDSPRGWSATKATGGIVIHVETNDIVFEGLSMPHSPRWYQDKLWLLNSGTGELWQTNPITREQQTICALPGFGRGLSLVGTNALVGLSQVRERHIFGGLPLQQQFDRLLCGVAVVDIQSGKTIGMLEFTDGCQELYDVAFLPNIQRPTFLNVDKDAAQRAITTPEFSYWLRSVN